MLADAEAAILTRVFEPDVGGVPADVAKLLLALDFPESDRRRMSDLSGKAADGVLTAGEREELEGYVSVGHLLALLHSKARRALRDEAPLGRATG